MELMWRLFGANVEVGDLEMIWMCFGYIWTGFRHVEMSWRCSVTIGGVAGWLAG